MARHGECSARARMHPSFPDVLNPQSLHRWLRKTALAAVPILGLTGCDDCTETSNYTREGYLPADAGWVVGSVHSSAECSRYCPSSQVCWHYDWDRCTVAGDGRLMCTGTEVFCGPRPCGRLPAGLRRASIALATPVATELAAAAHLEGAAVFAFRSLERELLAHRAPLQLVRRAHSAQQDEKRHYVSMSHLAHRHGARVPTVDVDPAPVRTLLELAQENAIEGCVRETYGAAVAAFQGEWAAEPVVRRVMRSIAVDEAEHASLGWAVDAWARTRLSRAQRVVVDDQRSHALNELGQQIERPVTSEAMSILGIPGTTQAAALSRALAPLWEQWA